MGVILSKEQLSAIDNMKNGCILCGGVGSGKSRTALGYYFFKVCGGHIRLNHKGSYSPMKNPLDLYIITTAKKRDSFEWDKECVSYMLNSNEDSSPSGVRVTIDSWNNIKKYGNVYGAFFIFDEQRVVGSGSWVKAFLRIANRNKWVLLSATPGDQWKDYVPVFVANGFFKNKTEFNKLHCIFSPYVNYPVISEYRHEDVLNRYRDSILVNIEDNRNTKRKWIDVKVGYDKDVLKKVMKERWDPYENVPIESIGKLYYVLRKVVNSSQDRIDAVRNIIEPLPFRDEKDQYRFIIFYNFTYELELLRDLCETLDYPYGEWNGQKHETIPKTHDWIYLVQYSAGCEGWNCIDTDTIIFYSQSYSYRMTEQAAGRIDRMNTPFDTLHYYRIRSSAWIDLAIYKALKEKQNFNEAQHYRTVGKGLY